MTLKYFLKLQNRSKNKNWKIMVNDMKIGCFCYVMYHNSVIFKDIYQLEILHTYLSSIANYH